MEFRIIRIGIGCAAPDNYSNTQLPLIHCVRRDPKATPPVDVMDYPNSYVFAVEVPGLRSGDVNVGVKDSNILTIAGERKRDEEDITNNSNNNAKYKYLKLERKASKFTRKFVLPENANADSISVVCQDGVLTVTVDKLLPAEPNTVQVQVT
ncbi:17.9 kDa class II heat shock protein-like [Diospyros lotus]|uniref:17.9 kDa class II heat shock protein-like n=1 Tax=Diospyros lotus TaxID=55363 RepID=UPI00224D5494|nr:17.9 kDa class II heat shock protein-like [Diospyros lotus]